MLRYRIEHRLAGWVVGIGWVLVMFALYSAIVATVFALKGGETKGFATTIQLLSYGLPMVLVGAACRAVFELADGRTLDDGVGNRAPDATGPSQIDTP